MLFIELYTYTCKFDEVMMIEVKRRKVTKKHAKFHKLDAEGINVSSFYGAKHGYYDAAVQQIRRN